MNSGNEKSDRKSTPLNKTALSSDASTTKFKPANQNIIRDLFIICIPIFVLYKISTHPIIASIGYVDPNTPKVKSQEEVLANMIKNLALNKYKEKYTKRKQLLEIVDPKKCYDFTGRINAAQAKIENSNNSNSGKRSKKKQRPTIKRSNRSHGKKKKMQFGRKSSSSLSTKSPSSAPVVSSVFASVMLAFNPSSTPAMKGEESNVADSSMPKQKTKKKKMSFKRG
jgi:hypothetical protein